ncbi:IPT/TIG domain-containing protein, partial [Bacteroides sp.]|uniref:IPT/TIG domain-containing protein n=1 Tax=Bacteroides sp. TaxID=29523 RepID=UPI00258AAFC7
SLDWLRFMHTPNDYRVSRGNTRMVIYGANFGTDPSIISVKIGGKEAIVVSSKGNSLYCLTPSLCFEGSVEVKIGKQSSKAQAKYEYEPQLVVSTLCGYLDEYGKKLFKIY